MSEASVRVLVDGLGIGESPRWHDGRLWFSHWGAEEVLAVDLDGNYEVVAPDRPRAGHHRRRPRSRLAMTGPGRS